MEQDQDTGQTHKVTSLLNAVGSELATQRGGGHNVGRMRDLFQQLTVSFEEEQRKFAEKQDALRQEQAALQHEKLAMLAKGVKSSDLVHLNIGGERITTKRSTLCQAPDTLLAYMFSGRWEEQLSRDEQGAVFLDFDATLFRPLLSWLRTQSLSGPAMPLNELLMPAGQQEDMLVLIDFLQMQRYLPLRYTEAISPELHGQHVVVSGSSAERAEGSRGNYAFAVGSHSYWDVEVELLLEVLSFACSSDEGNSPMFVGVLAKSKAAAGQLARYDLTWKPGCFGWWTRRGFTHSVANGHSSKGVDRLFWSERDTLLLTLDCRKQQAASKLTLCNTAQPDQRLSLSLDPSRLGAQDEWLLLLGLTHPGDQIRINQARRVGMRAQPR